VVYLDLDHFKRINDTLGHVVGDQLLVEVAARVLSCLREGDTLARLGGDDFLAILPNLADVAHSELVVKRVLKSFDEPFALGVRQIFSAASVGIAVFPTDADSADVLLRNAETAMYKAKDKGANTYHFFTPKMEEEARRRLDLESKLRQAVAHNRLALHYQPIIDAAAGSVNGTEALLRWNDPDLGAVGPNEFIPVAEDSGLIVPLGEWVLKTACEAAVGWGKSTESSLQISVNLSSRQFEGAQLVATVSRALRETGLPPERLVLEVTESLLLGESSDTNSALRELSAEGI
jgi:diguanylate cyclase (GGDEF)-like protein